MSNSLDQSQGVLLLRGIVAIIFALLLLFAPGITLAGAGLSFVILFSAYALIEGVSMVYGSISRREGHWVLMLLFGIVSVLAGLYALQHPVMTVVLTIAVMVYILAFKSIIGGIIEIITAWQLRNEIDHEWLLAISGLVSLLFGLILLRRPIATIEVLVLVTSFYLLISGATQIALSFKTGDDASASAE